jgi:excisionase family DNA binding protein
MASHVRVRPLWTTADLAAYLRASKRTVRRRVADGTLPVVRSGRLVRLDPDAVERALAAKSREKT